MPTSDSVLAAGRPVFDTRFVGQQRELASLRLLVDGSARLITLTGVGGSGTTRQAPELFAALTEARAGTPHQRFSRAREPVLSAAGWAARTRRDWEVASHHLTESSDRYRRLEDQVPYALGLRGVG